MRRMTGAQLALFPGDARAAGSGDGDLPVEAVSRIPQATAPAHRLASDVADRLSLLLGERVRLAVTNNTSTMVSFRRTRGALSLRVHRMFMEAPEEIVQALARFAGGSQDAGRTIDGFVRSNQARLRDARREKHATGLRAKGSVHDLGAIFEELNGLYFGSKIEARIGWAREAPTRRRRSIRLGVYLHESRVIRIHPALDRIEVPRYFVSFVVFHEMLHQAIPPTLVGGRRMAHTAEFRSAERAYPDYDKAIAWERENLKMLLRSKPKRYVFDLDDPLA